FAEPRNDKRGWRAKLRKTTPPGASLPAAGTGRGVLDGAGRPPVSFLVAPAATSRHPGRRARAGRRGMVAARRGGRARRFNAGGGDPRLLPGRGRGGPPVLAVPRRPPRFRSSAAVVCAWRVRVTGAVMASRAKQCPSA